MLKKIIFMGTPEFSVQSLRLLNELKSDFEIYVVSMPDKVRGRGKALSPSPVKQFALTNNLPIFTPNTKQELTKYVQDLNPFLIVVVAFGMILESDVVNRFFCVNVHASLLPKYRGASPIQTSLLNGDTKTGVTLIRLNESMDTGDILTSSELPIESSDNHGTLSVKLSRLGAQLCLNFIDQFLVDQDVMMSSQDHSKASYCQKITKDELLVNFGMDTSVIYNKIRAFSPIPGAYCVLNNRRIKLLDALFNDNYLELLKVQPEGKKAMSYKDYLLGNPEGLNFNGQ